MPKVGEDYFSKKRADILNAAVVILKKKPLYEMTMLDVIHEAGLSKGGIYRYFKDIDDLLVEMINRETLASSYQDAIQEILSGSLKSTEKLDSLLMLLARHIDESPDIVGKIQFELTVLHANHPDRANLIMSKLKENEQGQYLVASLFQQIIKGIASGEFTPVAPVEEIFTLIRITIEGLVKVIVLERSYGEMTRTVSPQQIMRLFSQNLQGLLKGQ